MFERDVTVGYVAAVLPKSMDYFGELGIDFCCGGNRVLADVLQTKGLEVSAVFGRLAQLEAQGKAQGAQTDFLTMSTEGLCAHVVDVHHAYLYRVMPEITQLMGAVMRAHGAQHPELFQVGRLFGMLRADLEQHLLREEMLLFPAVTQEDAQQAAILTPEIIAEHEHAGEVLEQLRELTEQYTVPADGCETYGKVYAMLSEMEADLHRHIHLENNILLKQYDIR